MRERNLLLFIFCLLILGIVIFLCLEAYSVYIVLLESSIQPLPLRESVRYVFSKTGTASRWVEVRSMELSTSGEIVTSVYVTWYRRFPPPEGYYITIRVELRDDSGYMISSGSVTGYYSGSGTVRSFIDLYPDVEIDKVAFVETSIRIGSTLTSSPTLSSEHMYLLELPAESGVEQA